MYDVMGCEVSYNERSILQHLDAGIYPSSYPNRKDWNRFLNQTEAALLRERMLDVASGNTITNNRTWSGLHIGIVDRLRKRRLLNIDQIESAIVNQFPQAKVERKSMEDLEPLQQFFWWSQQDVVLSAHGAAMVNMIFLRSNTAVVEIFPKHYLALYYWQMGNASGVRNYAYFNGIEDPLADYINHPSSKSAQKRDTLRNVDLSPPIDEILKLVKKAVVDKSNRNYSRCNEFPQFCNNRTLPSYIS